VRFRVSEPEVKPLFAPARPRVLLVDDEPLVLKVFGRSLVRNKYLVREALTGGHALELLSGQWFDVVVADVRMHPMDGFELLARTRELDVSIPVILVSGFPDVGAPARARELGAFAYIAKPVLLEVLRATVRSAVERRRWRSG